MSKASKWADSKPRYYGGAQSRCGADVEWDGSLRISARSGAADWSHVTIRPDDIPSLLAWLNETFGETK